MALIEAVELILWAKLGTGRRRDMSLSRSRNATSLAFSISIALLAWKLDLAAGCEARADECHCFPGYSDYSIVIVDEASLWCDSEYASSVVSKKVMQAGREA